MIWSDDIVQWYDTRRIEAILEAPTNQPLSQTQQISLKLGQLNNEQMTRRQNDYTMV